MIYFGDIYGIIFVLDIISVVLVVIVKEEFNDFFRMG